MWLFLHCTGEKTEVWSASVLPEVSHWRQSHMEVGQCGFRSHILNTAYTMLEMQARLGSLLRMLYLEQPFSVIKTYSE